MDIGTTLDADLAAVVVPGMRSLMAMVCSSFDQATSAADEPPRKSGSMM
jgi:hypothetical protein